MTKTYNPYVKVFLVVALVFGGASAAFAQSSRSDIVDGFSLAFEGCLNAVRRDDIGELGQAETAATPSYALVRPGASFSFADDTVVASIFQTPVSGDGSTTIRSCRVTTRADQYAFLRRDIIRWVQETAAQFVDRYGAHAVPAGGATRSYRWTWCEQEADPYQVTVRGLYGRSDYILAYVGRPIAYVGPPPLFSSSPCEGEQ